MSYFINFPEPIGIKNVNGVDSYVPYTSDDGLHGIKVTMMNGAVKTSDYADAGVYASSVRTIAAPTDTITLTSVTEGVAGNATAFKVVVGGIDTVASVSVLGSIITFNSATEGAGVATSTASELKAAIEADVDASALITVALGNVDGSTIVGILSQESLIGGVDDDSETTRDAEMSRLDGLLMLGA